MTSNNFRPTVDEIHEVLKRSCLPTVLVEGKDDIIFYRSVENELRDLGVDMLPAGNKDAVLELRKRIIENPVLAPIVFIVDNDLWVYPGSTRPESIDDVITTNGYSIENDLYVDGDLECLLSPEEVNKFKCELINFSKWYALVVNRNLNGVTSSFRTHPSKVLDDKDFYNKELELQEGETYPEELFCTIVSNYSYFLRGKSLLALLLRQLSASKRDVKFGIKQLMAIGASKKGGNFQKIQLAVEEALR